MHLPKPGCNSEGAALLGELVARPSDSEDVAGSGLARWERRDGRWRLIKYTPVPGAEGAFEPSLIRDGDAGATWEQTLQASMVRAGTPVTINKAVDGTVYIAGNPHCETDSRGQKLPSIETRETLLLWPLSQDRTQLLEPVLVRDCNADFGKPPFGSIWRADHPVGLTVRLKDGQWRHVLAYRVLEQSECTSDAPATSYTGTYPDLNRQRE